MMTIRPDIVLNTFRILIHDAEEGGCWAEVLGLPGCVSQGEDEEELLVNIREAIEAVLAVQYESAPTLFQADPVIADKDVQTHSNVDAATWTAVQQ